MSAFNVQEFTIPGQHIREYPNGTRNDQEDVLEIAVKKYTPRNKTELQNGAVTVITANATGFPKVDRAQLACRVLTLRRNRKFWSPFSMSYYKPLSLMAFRSEPSGTPTGPLRVLAAF